MDAKSAIPISAQLRRMLDVARTASMPVLLKGSHGIGKSEFLLHYAQQRGLQAYELDLSLLESTDLTGIPYIQDGQTHFAPPAILPPTDSHKPTMLILEELNRCDRSVRQPCLQLLTARKLNEYILPQDCFLVACVNPDGQDYQVDSLDPALASRFLTLQVEPDAKSWLKWAREACLFPGIIRFVEKFPQAFERVPPRTWTYAARLLEKGIAQGWSVSEMEAFLVPLLGSIAAQALLVELPDEMPRLAPSKLLAEPARFVETFEAWMTQQRVDIIGVVLEETRQYLRKQPVHLCDTRLHAMMQILDIVPADLGLPILELIERKAA